MADPPDDPDDWLGDFTDEERQQVEAARKKFAAEREASNVTPFDPKRKRKPKPPPTPAPPPEGWPAWHVLTVKDDKGRIFANVENVMVGLRHDDVFKTAFAFDEMRQDAILLQSLPMVEGATASPDPPRPVTDDDVTRAQAWLQRRGFPLVSRETVGQAIEAYARERRFHPVRDWLNGLAWDGVARLPTWMFSFLGAQATDALEIEYVRMIGTMFLIAMAARVFKPGCQADYMLVLEGDQGILKSTACRVLAGEWFTDSLPDSITGKDAKQHMRGKWGVEIKELASFKKAQIEDLKSFIDRREEEYRPPYAKRNVVEPRQCVLIGTTNESVWIKDETGGRRFWPVKCALIDVAGLEAARNQLFAEAVYRFKAGERWWPTHAEEVLYFKPQQDARTEEDPWFPDVAKWLDAQMEDRFTVSQVLRLCLGFENASRITRQDQFRIGSIFRLLGWTLERSAKGRFYKRPKPADDDDDL